MTSPYSAFKNDEDLELKVGVLLDYDDYRIRIARAGGSNKKFEKLFTAKMKPYRYQMDSETMKDEVAVKLMIELYVDSIVLGWEVKNDKDEFVSGIYDDDHKILPFTRENAIKVFTDYPDLFKDVQMQSRRSALFKALETEETVKNL